jgi:hypothetical protein
MQYRVDDFAIELEKIEPILGEGLLSEWEEIFLTSLKSKPATMPISPKQVLILSDIIEKCEIKGWLE